MEILTFKSNNEFGREIVFDVIATYHDDDTNKNFIVYTDKTYDEDNKLKIYYSLYKIVDNNIELIKTMDMEDKKTGLQLIQDLVKNINN